VLDVTSPQQEPMLASASRVISLTDVAPGLSGYLVIDSTARGPAFGGIRLAPYDCAGDALADARRLARVMTLKAALAALPCGGAKAVLMDDPNLDRTLAFRGLAEVVEEMNGQVFLGPDIGVTSKDLALMRQFTSYVADPSDHVVGEISWYTAFGVLQGIRACAAFSRHCIHTVAIQGVGKVGRRLAHLLAKDGFKLILSDVSKERIKMVAAEFDAVIVRPEDVLSSNCDVLAPCAMDGLITAANISAIRAGIICGSANSILAETGLAEELRRAGILHAPDLLVNAGGVIRGVESHLLHRQTSLGTVAKIYGRVLEVLCAAEARGTAPAIVALERAERACGWA